MYKEFLAYDTVRDDALLIGKEIFDTGFFPDVIVDSLRGGAPMANVISEYFSLVAEKKSLKKPLYAGVVASSYKGVKESGDLKIDGWTIDLLKLSRDTKILLTEDIFDSGKTVNGLVSYLLSLGFSRENIKVVVHDYKIYKFKDEQLPVQPDFWCRKFEIEKSEDDMWIHYMSHELKGLTKEEAEEHYYKKNPSLKKALDFVLSAVFALTLFFLGSNLFADSRIISPISGIFCNKQPLIVDLSDGSECFYSLTGSSPLVSGLAYDGPFLIDSTGDVELNLVIINDNKVENFKISYKVIPLEAEDLEEFIEVPDGKGGTKAVLSQENEFLKKISMNPIQEIFTDEVFTIPDTFKYSFDNEIEPYIDGKALSLDKANNFFAWIPVTCSFEDKLLHFVLKVVGGEPGTFSKKEIPFEIRDWTNFKFTGKKLIWSIDGGFWSANDKEFYVDRTIPHILSWQDVAYEKGNPIYRYEIPPVPAIEKSGGGREKVKFSLKGNPSYKMELVSAGKHLCTGESNGLYSEILIDVFEGDSIDSSAVFDVYFDGVSQGKLSVPYAIDKKSPAPPMILSSTLEHSFSRETVSVVIESNDEGDVEVFYALSDAIKIESRESLRDAAASGFLDSVPVGAFRPYNNVAIPLVAGKDSAVFYKVASYAVDSFGNRSSTSYFSIVIDENNYYLSEKKDKKSTSYESENGSYLAPFTSLDKILKIVNSGKFSKVYVSGVIEVTGGEKKIISNCEFIAEKDARFVFDPDSSLKITAAAAEFNGIIFEKRKNVMGLSNTTSLLTFENATGDFKDCEIVGVFYDNGTALDSVTSVLHFENSRLTAAGDSYVAAISASRSKIYLKSSKVSTVGSTSVNFSVSNSIFEAENCECRVSGRLGRIAEFNGTEVKLRGNTMGAELENSGRTSVLEAIWKDESTKIYENEGNRISGF